MKIKDFYSEKLNNIKNNSKVYICGPTVYDDVHIGNIRPVIIFDILNRLLSYKKYKVNYIHNITDIDDKIITRAKELNISESKLSKKYYQEYLKILKSINILMPNEMPKVTDNIEGMILFIQTLIKDGYAYESNGSIYFNVNSLENYGAIDNLSLDKLSVVEEKNIDKKNIHDFVLWKKTNVGINFSSPWGKGRPGWHTECAFLIDHFFGKKGIDIHVGGIDLKFPHHINEMALYESVNKISLSKNWLYVGHVNLDSKKMSKSENNFWKAKDFLKEYNSNILRMILISTNYLKPLDINKNIIETSINNLDKIKNAIKKSLVILAERNLDIVEGKPSKSVIKSLENNLDISLALTNIFSITKKLNLETNLKLKKTLVETLIADLHLLGFSFEINFNKVRKDFIKLKQNKDFQKSDLLIKEFIK